MPSPPPWVFLKALQKLSEVSTAAANVEGTYIVNKFISI